MTRVTTLVTCGAFALTSACSSAPTGSVARVDPGQAQQLVGFCMDQSQAPGAYNWSFEGRLPVAMSLTQFGGTRKGAQKINACVRRNAARYQTDPSIAPVNTAAATPDPVLSDPEPLAPGGVRPAADRKPAPAPAPAATPTPAPRTVATPASRQGCPPGVSGFYRGTVLC